MTASAISAVASRAASNGRICFSSTHQKMFSSTTMASSMIVPNHSAAGATLVGAVAQRQPGPAVDTGLLQQTHKRMTASRVLQCQRWQPVNIKGQTLGRDHFHLHTPLDSFPTQGYRIP